ncbi:MAG: T9SS type A sorting domain-containing protein [Deltaproteobacteria bacterium]|nr:T9SS type A sorting domain-containing protein [Deltaproteobacteria bacterium]
MMMLRNQRKSKNLLGLIFFLAIGVALIIGLPQKAVATNMDLGFDDKLWDERHTSDVKYYVKFPQYFEVPYQVTNINIVATYNNSYQVMIFPDNGSGLPDTTDVLLTAGYSWMEGDKPEGFYGIQWLPFTVNGNGIIESPGPVWLEFRFPPDVTRLFGVDTNSPDGRSYYYDGDYHQYLDGDYMMRIVEEGVALQHDVLVKDVDIPHRYTVPAEHSIIPRIFVENAGQNIETFGVTCVIDSSDCNVYTSTFPFPVTLEPQSTTPITFAPWDVGGENSVYDITFYTQLEEDMWQSNDTINITVTASFVDTLRYDFNMGMALCGWTCDINLIVRITPQAYPCKLMEAQPCFSIVDGTMIPVMVMEDANPDSLDIFEPGAVIWSGYRTISGQGFQHFDLSEENIIINQSDVEAYVCVVSPAWHVGYCLGNDCGAYNSTNRFNTLENYDGNCNYLIPVVVNYLPQVGVEDTAGQIPKFDLSQNYPNPFSTSTTISFNLATKSHKNTQIRIYNVKGQLVKQLSIFNSQSSIEWDGKDENGKQLSSGIYFYRLTAGDFTDTKKCIILK